MEKLCLPVSFRIISDVDVIGGPEGHGRFWLMVGIVSASKLAVCPSDILVP